VEFFRDRDWDIVGKARLWFLISATVIIAGLVVWGVRGLNYGIDFTGGSLHRYAFDSPLAGDDAGVPSVTGRVRDMLQSIGLANTQIQVVSNDKGQLSDLYLRTPSVANDEEAMERDKQIVAGLKKLYPDKGEISDLGRETVGPVVGRELQYNALLALVVGWVLILVYITVRYEFRFAVAGIAALVHDTLIVMGCMALFRVELNSAFVAAILTVLGYSINDSVVIFDRIRENMRLRRRADFADTVNRSLLQTLARSINTSLTTLFTLVALFLFGGESISGFSLALIVGITTGSYSSIFIASPIVVLWEGRAARARAEAVAGARGSGRSRAAAVEVDDAPQTEAQGAKTSQDAVIERLQREEAEERDKRVGAEEQAKREERRERRKKQRQRDAKKSKRRF